MRKSRLSALRNAIFGIVCLAYTTGSEGTSIIVYRTPQNIVVAADSRLTRSGRIVNDLDCKIMASTNGIVVGTANVSNVGDIDFTAEAMKIATENQFRNQDDLDAIAKKWAEFVKAIYETKIGPERKASRTETSSEAVFVGYDELGKGLTAIISVNLFWKNSGAMDVEVSSVNRGAPVPARKFVMNPLGHAQTTFDRLKDPAWKKRPEAKGVLEALTTADTIAEEETAADNFTKLAGDWFPESVGGDTDIVVLRPKQAVSWLRRKASCKE